MIERSDPAGERRLDLAARAAWLYYFKSRTQEQIATELNISRQIVQRLIALANSERLIRFQLIHPLAESIELADRLRDRFELIYCDVCLSESGSSEDIPSVATQATFYLENIIQQKAPLTIGMGSGGAMREVSRRLPPMDRPQHHCVSLMGNLTRDGRATHYDVVTRLAERLNAQCYPLPVPVVTNTIEEREVLQAQPGYGVLRSLVEEATLLIMGIGFWGPQATLYRDGFITAAETAQAMDAGGVGELLGCAISADGEIVDAAYHDRLTSFVRTQPADRPTTIVASGVYRAPAIRAALKGRLANSLITDENTARLVLSMD
ncbi:DNA-binding transcriptional regulator [Mesorhizobium sanjuanii]|uniref:DNA-binding transcriptional regulator n=2 Tax=Mesorhizobium TaxID=68287 RepID=A0A2A6FAY5_9HYPH|nr:MULTISPECIES: sugar-binding domain-containing protein [Mesorhizobium]PDQ18821.1 DNA-binding transcriptional regulator [Mesorhizobium sanjuanii]PTE08169.1 DNA-binding transcriptional regulator [Mesorhizobium helmanticense]